MRSKTTCVTQKSRAQTPDRASKYQLTGPSPSRPRPRITYGKSSKNRSLPNSPFRHQSPLVASTSTTCMESSASDYEDPIVIPDTPPFMKVPGLSDSKDTSSPSVFTRIKMDDPCGLNNVGPEICLQSSPARLTRAFTREAKLKDALARSEENLKLALQDAQDAKNEIKAFKEAEKVRSECPCCTQVMLQPFM
ncbi:hypothetical protein C8J55DRAFT_557472 [Lentinula edodes]|uniref:Uncharacterized protein n=1 Tax=Lentinula lateritia TaxID=40482 RepID=A0A9W9ASH0_9AGAR|nr:hypothetical protein C8J55DRAFT_557472 [Lentinula edodes]